MYISAGFLFDRCAYIQEEYCNENCLLTAGTVEWFEYRFQSRI